MKAQALCRVGLLMSCVAAASVAGAGGVDIELVRIDDPAALAERGLEPDTILWKAIASSEGVVEPSEPEFGVSYADYVPIMSTSFLAANSDAQWGITTGNALYCQGMAIYMFFDGEIVLPLGSLIQGVSVWTYDIHPTENVHAFVWEECQPPLSGGDVVSTELIDVPLSTGAAGNYYYYCNVNPDRLYNGYACVYRLRVRLGDADGDCNGSSLRLYKARVAFKRQISPAPAAATFSDVPVGHPFFQHVEALYDSGITAGCGGSSFCPDSPLTRGQMAVFLAKALGLHWDASSF